MMGNVGGYIVYCWVNSSPSSEIVVLDLVTDLQTERLEGDSWCC